MTIEYEVTIQYERNKWNLISKSGSPPALYSALPNQELKGSDLPHEDNTVGTSEWIRWAFAPLAIAYLSKIR